MRDVKWKIVAGALALLVGATGASASSALTVRISSAPPSTSTSPQATFAWTANETAQFTCSLDGSRAEDCNSPKTYSGLAEGAHDFLVVASNTDRTGKTYTARDAHRWTIDLPGPQPPPPPPPPPAPKTAKLLVSVEGGGQVSSDPAGIDCPGDCEQSFPLGTKVSLSPRAGSGFGFAGWHGACDGGGACAPALSSTALVLAVFKNAGPQPHLYRGDREGDGVSNARDACPSSPRRLKMLLAGCTAVDLLNGPDALLADVGDALDLARQKTVGTKGLKLTGHDLSRVMDLIELGGIDASQGDPCGGAATIGKGARLLAQANAPFAAVQKQVAKQPPPNGEGDADETDLQLAGLHYRQGLLGQAAGKVAKLQRAYAAICGDLGKKVELVGRVGKTKDAQGLLELRTGQLISLAGADYDPDDIWEGGRVRILTHKIESGSWLAESVVALDKPLVPLNVLPCVSLRIAPVQDFFKADPTLHQPNGYSFNGVLRLEAGMRFAVSPKCVGAKSGRYSLAITISNSEQAYAVAVDLDSNDPPAPLPVGGGASLWKITVYERYQSSSCFTTKNLPCPVQHRSTTEYKARILDQGAYGRAGYEKTIFPLESSAPQSTKVDSIYPLHYTIQPSKVTFEAEGYKPGGSPGPLVTVKKNETFSLWPDTYYGAPLLFMLDSIGVDHFAGLLWPRIVGTRNGHPFRYTAELPKLVKDLLPNCPNQACFYKLPWKVATGVTTKQGNGPGFSHNGKQLYAFDFGMSEGDTIYATRGGVVGDLVESNEKNFNPCADNNGNGVKGDEEDKKADGPTNYVRIDHDDDTYSYYAHVQLNSVIPAKGSVVQRGDPIAHVGNVGRSCGPHLHYQVATDKSDTIYGQTTPICFEGWLALAPTVLDFRKCYKPVKPDLMYSTNG